MSELDAKGWRSSTTTGVFIRSCGPEDDADPEAAEGDGEEHALDLGITAEDVDGQQRHAGEHGDRESQRDDALEPPFVWRHGRFLRSIWRAASTNRPMPTNHAT